MSLLSCLHDWCIILNLPPFTVGQKSARSYPLPADFLGLQLCHCHASVELLLMTLLKENWVRVCCCLLEKCQIWTQTSHILVYLKQHLITLNEFKLIHFYIN